MPGMFETSSAGGKRVRRPIAGGEVREVTGVWSCRASLATGRTLAFSLRELELQQESEQRRALG